MRHSDLERELSLILMMTENREYTVPQMCDRLGISRRSCYYYIDFLRDAGFVVEKHGACYSLDKTSPFFMKLLRKVHFTEDEAVTMRRLLDRADSGSLQIQHLKQKIERLYDLDILENVASREQEAQNVSVLYEAIKLKRLVVFHRYSSPHSNTLGARVVEPFMFLNGNNEIRCYEPRTKTNKTFKISRIGEVQMLADEWEHEDAHKRLFTDIFLFSGEQTMPVELRLDRLAGNLFKEEFPMHAADLKADGNDRWRLWLDVCSYVGVSRFVLGLADHIEVLGSDDFKDFLKSRVTQMAARMGVTQKEETEQQ